MKIMHAVLIAFAMLFIGVAHAAPPSVIEVEKTIASGDYTKAKSQLEEVLKTNPDSIVAAKYMLEIVRIENARDNQPSVEYKLYEDRVAKLEKAKADRIAAEKKALEEKKWQERKAASLKTFIALIVAVVLGFFGWVGYNRYSAMQAQKREEAEERQRQKEMEDWCEAVEKDMLDIGDRLESVSIRSGYNSQVMKALKDLTADNFDALQSVKDRDYNRDMVIRHIRNAKQYLRERCGEDI